MVLSCAALLLWGGSALAEPVTPVKVEGGQVRGVVEDGLTVYRGIPYAAPPVGNLRWRAPQPAPKWDGVRDAAEYGRACMQSNPAISNLPAPSEDCLFVNVWTPAMRAGERLPVMVWIHGGGFTAGTPAEQLYHGEWLASKGVVVVSVGYRLGVFGFLSHPGLSAESNHHVSGNYGLLDMVAGLQWVRKNITAFGGDPGRVTIFGESAGAIAVSQLCASPLAKGLFQAAISESGGSFGPVRAGGGPGENMQPLRSAEDAGTAWARSLGASTVADLRKIPAEKLLADAQRQRGLAWPITDGWVVPDDQYKLYQAGRYNDVPVLIGYNSDEGASFGPPASQQAYVDSVRQRYGQFADKLLAAYPGGETPTAKKTGRDLTRDTAFGWHTWTWARLQGKTGKSGIFLYYFDEHPQYPADSPRAGFGTPHSEELPYVFRQLREHRRPPPTAADEAMSDLMRTYWTNFAKTGDPNGAGVPRWPAFSNTEPRMMHIASGNTTAGPIVSEGGLKALDEYFAWRRTTEAGPAGAGQALRQLGPDVVITASDCTSAKVATSIAASAIGEPVRSVTLSSPAWVEAAGNVPAHCRVNGSIAPVDTSATAKPINFSVVLPASWSRRAAQLGGAGINGFVPNLTGGGPSGPGLVTRGFATYGSDSGHQASFGQGRRGGPPSFGPNPAADDWTLNEEAIANLGYMQMKKTHDAAMAIIERVYGMRPRFNYFVGSSQGGREALTVAERYPADYDGIAANVPIVGFSTLMLAPELIRINEKPMASWVTPAKINAIRGEFMRQCDSLDGLADGIINNYMACRAIFDVSQGSHNRHPWAAKRCPDNVDPNPADTSAAACLTDGQISTLALTYSRYRFATALAFGARTFGMWVPNTDPSGSGLILNSRFKGQEGAADDAPMHSHLGVLGVVGFLMKDLSANPLDYTEGGTFNRRREALSAVLDSTNPDLSAFARRGGKMIVTIGTNDTLASPGAQLDYYQSVLDRMGRASVDRFARLFVMPQTGHGLSGTNYGVDGDGRAIPSQPIPNRYDQVGLLVDWVEKDVVPGKSVTVAAGDKSLPLCSYPSYPRYRGGAPASASSYECAAMPAK